MSRLTTTAAIPLDRHDARVPAGSQRAADYVELTKPRIVALELVTVIVAAHLAAPWGIDPWVLLHAVLGAALVAASAGAFNQWWERATDARMPRTADRPLPAGRLTSRQVRTVRRGTLIAGVVGTDAGRRIADGRAGRWPRGSFTYSPTRRSKPARR